MPHNAAPIIFKAYTKIQGRDKINFVVIYPLAINKNKIEVYLFI